MLLSDKSLDGKLLSLLTSGSERKVELVCDLCGKHSITSYHNYILSQIKNKSNGKTKCKTCATKISGKDRIGKSSWNKGNKKLANERHGRPFISSDGYRMIFHFKDDPKSKWEYYIKEHIFIVEQFLNRKLEKNEEIHHINGDKLDNSLDNLFLTTKNEHKTLHHSLQLIGYELYKRGVIIFDLTERKYKIKETI